MARTDYERFDALERAGFKLERFGDILYHVNERAGGHYMDIGTSAKIAAGLVSISFISFGEAVLLLTLVVFV